MDIGSLLTGNAVLSAASAGVMLMVLCTRKTYPGFGSWTSGVACLAIGAAMFVPGWLPDSWFVLTARNSAILVGLLLFLRGMRVFRGLPPAFGFELLIALSFVPLFAFYSQDVSHLAARIVLFSAYAGVLALVIVATILRHRPDHFGSNDWLLASWLTVFASLSLLRCAGQLLQPTNQPAFASLTGFQSFYILTQVLTIHMITLALININSQRIEHEHRVAEARLRESEGRLVTILDNLGNHVYVKDPQGRYLYANRHAAAHLGQPLLDILGRTDAELRTPETAQRLRVHDLQVLASGRPSACEEALEDGEGRQVPFWSTRQTVTFEGAPALIGVSSDISQVKQLEASVRRAKEFVEALIESANVMLLGLDRQGRVLFINAKGEEIVGYPRSELLGQDWFALMQSQDPGSIARGSFDETMRGGSHQAELENTIWTRAGTPRRVLCWNSVVRNADDERILVSCGIDVTEQRRIEAELSEYRETLERRVAERTADLARLTDSLRAAHEQLEAIFDAASSGIMLLRAEIVERCNRRLCDMTGFEATELIGQPCSLIEAAPQAGVEATTPLLARLARGEAYVSERRIRRKDGTTFIARWTSHALDVDNLSKGIVQLVEDITVEHGATEALKRAKDDAEKANRAKATFLANMSHEIRTPMNAIIGLTHLMARDTQELRAKDRLAKVDSAARHLLRVINDVLDLSKIEAGKMVLDISAFSLDRVLSDVFGLIGREAHDKGIECILDTGRRPECLPDRLVGDPTRLTQALLNLLSNAVKFTDRGWVRLRCRLLHEEPRGLLARFEVTDTGMGIDPVHQGALFNAFEQADASTTRRHGGTGLGLALTRHIARSMDGEAGFDSTPGVGSTFWFTAWLARDGTAPEPAPYAPAHGLRALLVDDLAGSRVALGHVLSNLGVVVEAHATAESAMLAVEQARAGEWAVDLMLIGERPGGVDAGQMLEMLRWRVGLQVPSILLATSDEDASVRSLQAGAQRRLVKPITATVLTAALSDLFGQPVPDRRAAANSQTAAEPSPRFMGQRVLLVEDNLVNLEIASELLHSAGLEVVTADTGLAAVDLALSEHFDAILMDVQMPGMDGLSATRLIRRKLGQAVPIIAMTANAYDEDRQDCLAAGMTDHLAKPVDPDALYAKLARWLGTQIA